MFVNRLREYLDNNPVTWRKLQEMTDISTTTIAKIARVTSEEDFKWVSLGSYKTLKEKCGVDLLDCNK